MRVQQLLPLGKKVGKRVGRALPKTMGAIQTRVEKMGSGVVDRFQAIRSSAALSSARKAVRRGGERTVHWIKKNPRAIPWIGLGGALATFLMVRAGRKSRRTPQLVRGTMQMLGGMPRIKKGIGAALSGLMSWALTPRKPHVFRAVTIKW